MKLYLLNIIRNLLIKIINIFYLISYILAKKNQYKIILSNGLNSKKYIIYSIFCSTKIPNNILVFINFFINKNYTIYLINNSKLQDISNLKNLKIIYVERDNLGRDFGGYQCGYKLISETLAESKKLEEVVFINQSVLILNDRLEKFYKKLKSNSDSDVLFLSDSFERKWHGASWFFKLNNEAFFSNSIKNFFYNYKPLNSRPYAIEKGEIAFSQLVLNEGFSIQVLFNQNIIKEKMLLESSDFLDYRSLYNLLPIGFIHNKLRLVNPSLLSEFFLFAADKNSTHNFSLLLLKYFDSFPFLKKDIINRGVFKHNQIDENLYSYSMDLEDKQYFQDELFKHLRKSKSLLDKLRNFSGFY
jgi:hypothetical protein